MSALMRGPYMSMLADLFGKLWSHKLWRVLIGFYSTVVVGATAKSFTNPKRSRDGKNRSKGKGRGGGSEGIRGQNPRSFRQQYARVFRIAVPSWRSATSIRIWIYGIIIIARSVLNIVLIRIGSQGLKLITQKDWLNVFRMQSYYMTLCVPLAVLNASMRYQQNRLAVAMRKNLVDHVHKNYLNKQSTFYCVSALGPDLLSTLDQRCTQDIEEFCTESAALYGNIVKPLTEILTFSQQIAASLGTRQLIIFLGYFMISSKWLQMIMPSFGRLTAQQQELEGTFRSMHSRILANAEEIAFHSGGPRERERVEDAFKEIVSVKRRIFKHRAYMSFMDTTAVKHCGMLLSYEIMIPTLYLGREGMQLATEADRTAYLIAAMQFFGGLANALNILYQNSYVGITTLSGLASRVDALVGELQLRGGAEDGVDVVSEQIIADVRRHPQLQSASVAQRIVVTPVGTTKPDDFEGASIAWEGVDVFSPAGALLLAKLTVTVQRGQHLIIEGPNGA